MFTRRRSAAANDKDCFAAKTPRDAKNCYDHR